MHGEIGVRWVGWGPEPPDCQPQAVAAVLARPPCTGNVNAEFKNSDGKTVYTRYVGEQHVKEDCNGIVPSASDWIKILISNERPLWVTKTTKLEFED